MSHSLVFPISSLKSPLLQLGKRDFERRDAKTKDAKLVNGKRKK